MDNNNPTQPIQSNTQPQPIDPAQTVMSPQPEQPMQPNPLVTPQATTPGEGGKKMIFWLIGGVLAVVLVVGGIYFFLSSQQKPPEEETATTEEPAPVSQPSTEVTEADVEEVVVDDVEKEFQTVDQDLQGL